MGADPWAPRSRVASAVGPAGPGGPRRSRSTRRVDAARHICLAVAAQVLPNVRISNVGRRSFSNLHQPSRGRTRSKDMDDSRARGGNARVGAAAGAARNPIRGTGRTRGTVSALPDARLGQDLRPDATPGHPRRITSGDESVSAAPTSIASWRRDTAAVGLDPSRVRRRASGTGKSRRRSSPTVRLSRVSPRAAYGRPPPGVIPAGGRARPQGIADATAQFGLRPLWVEGLRPDLPSSEQRP